MRRLPLSLILCASACNGGGASDGTESSGGSTEATTGATTGATASPTGSGTDTPTTGEPTGGNACNESPQTLADCVDPAAFEEDINFIADLRTPGTTHWQAVQDLCADRLTEYGYEVALQDYGTGINVVGRRLGATTPEQIVLVGAHYDHIADCLGADDNASGVAATLEIARMLGQAEFDRTVVIACWDEEELGLVGSEAYVAAAVAAKDQIVVNFNFDMIGFRSDADNSQTVPPGFEAVFPEPYAELEAQKFRGDFIAVISHTLAHDQALVYQSAAERIGLASKIIEIPDGLENSELFDDLRRSDHAAFWLAGFPALFITDTGEFRNDHYHCMSGPDEVADLDLDFAVQVTRATVEAGAVTLGM
jgi:hypothetical protein